MLLKRGNMLKLTDNDLNQTRNNLILKMMQSIGQLQTLIKKSGRIFLIFHKPHNEMAINKLNLISSTNDGVNFFKKILNQIINKQ